MSVSLGGTAIPNWSRINLTNIESDCIINFPQTATSISVTVFPGMIQAYVSNLVLPVTPITAGIAQPYDI